MTSVSTIIPPMIDPFGGRTDINNNIASAVFLTKNRSRREDPYFFVVQGNFIESF